MDFNATVSECQKKLRAVGYGHIPTVGELKPYASIDLLVVMDQIVAKVQRSGQPDNAERYLSSTLAQELSKRTKPPNKQYFVEADEEDLPVKKAGV